MIPSIFARAVEEDIVALAICADYLEDHGKDGYILRIIADNHFLLDDSGFCYSYIINYGTGIGNNIIGNNIRYGDENGSGSGYSYSNGNGSGYSYDNIDTFGYGYGNGNGFGFRI